MTDKMKESLNKAVFKPAFCLLVVSKICNFRCKMCNMWKNKERSIDRKELTIEEMKGFVDDLKNVATEPIFIHLIGGEAEGIKVRRI